jgi:hypothetical protein
VVALDGKTPRDSFDRQNRRPPLHLISAWARAALADRRPTSRRCTTNLLLDDPQPHRDEIAATTAGDHGWIETRGAAILHDIAWLAGSHTFPGLSAVGKVTVVCEQDRPTTTATRHCLLSRPLSAVRLLAIASAHGQIEKLPHWAPDVALDEDLA